MNGQVGGCHSGPQERCLLGWWLKRHKGIHFGGRPDNLVMMGMWGKRKVYKWAGKWNINRIIKAIYCHVQSCIRQGHSVEEARGVVTQITLPSALVKP